MQAVSREVHCRSRVQAVSRQVHQDHQAACNGLSVLYRHRTRTQHVHLVYLMVYAMDDHAVVQTVSLHCSNVVVSCKARHMTRLLCVEQISMCKTETSCVKLYMSVLLLVGCATVLALPRCAAVAPAPCPALLSHYHHHTRQQAACSTKASTCCYVASGAVLGSRGLLQQHKETES